MYWTVGFTIVFIIGFSIGVTIGFTLGCYIGIAIGLRIGFEIEFTVGYDTINTANRERRINTHTDGSINVADIYHLLHQNKYYMLMNVRPYGKHYDIIQMDVAYVRCVFVTTSMPEFCVVVTCMSCCRNTCILLSYPYWFPSKYWLATGFLLVTRARLSQVGR